MKLFSWVKAARLPSQSYIALPLVLGQVHAYASTGRWDWTVFILVQLFGIFDQFYIVFANDYADIETDKDNQTSTIFSGGSRVLVEGVLSPQSIKKAAWICAIACVVLGGILSVQSFLILPLVIVGLLLLWAYSYPPIELSYRGGGEFLQALGVGVVLPLIGFAAQSGSIENFPWWLLAFVVPLQYACAITTALPDEPSDRRAKKRTVPVLVGGTFSRVFVLLANTGVASVYSIYFYSPWVTVAWIGVGLQLATVFKSTPGSWQMNVFAFSSILTNLAIVASEVIRVTV